MPALNSEGTRKYSDLPFFIWSDADGLQFALKELISELGTSPNANIALDETMRADFAALVKEVAPKTQCQICASIIGGVRMRKDQIEFRLLNENALIVDRVMEAVWSSIKAGMT